MFGACEGEPEYPGCPFTLPLLPSSARRGHQDPPMPRRAPRPGRRLAPAQPPLNFRSERSPWHNRIARRPPRHCFDPDLSGPSGCGRPFRGLSVSGTLTGFAEEVLFSRNRGRSSFLSVVRSRLSCSPSCCGEPPSRQRGLGNFSSFEREDRSRSCTLARSVGRRPRP